MKLNLHKSIQKLLCVFAVIGLSFLNVPTAFAWRATLQVTEGISNDFLDSLSITCNPDEKVCEDVCNEKDFCWKEQELCLNCFGTANLSLRTVYTELERLYYNTHQILNPADTAKVFSAHHTFVSARSIYNFYSNIDSPDVMQRFQSLCPESIGDPIVVLEKNRRQEPEKIKYIICDRSESSDQGIYILVYSPQVEEIIKPILNP
jgi:hypothetical protein